MIDLTFSNTGISGFFETGKNPPISELLYLHDHPLVKPNFINQLETQMGEMGKEISRRGLQGKVLNDLTRIAISIGSMLPTLGRDNAEAVLLEMKNAYDLGKSIGIGI